MEKLIVVGEKFSDFAARNKNVLTVNEFERFVWSNEIQSINKIIIGQGVELEHISRSFSIIRQNYPEKIKDIVNLQDLFYQNNKEHQKSAHKKKSKNVLITSPEKKEQNIYVAKLIYIARFI